MAHSKKGTVIIGRGKNKMGTNHLYLSTIF